MRPFKVVITGSAERDLVEVAAWYVARHPEGAERFFEAFAKARQLLARHPHAGRERPELRAGLRSWAVHPYVVFYHTDGTARLVSIERVLHGRMDIGEQDLGD